MAGPRPRNDRREFGYTSRDYVMMLRAYFLAGESLAAARRLYGELYPNARLPDESTFLRVYQNALDYGQFQEPTHTQGRGRPSYNIYDDVLDWFEEDPRRSTNEAARHFGISQYCAWRIVSSSGQHPYHFRKVQELSQSDRAPRMQFCEWLLDHHHENILFTDECLFTRIGLFNCHNEHYWDYVNPHNVRQHSFQNRFSVNVWAGIINGHVIGPHFISDRLTGQRYLRMLPRLLDDVPLIYLRDSAMYYQHDGAPPHYAIVVREYLTERFGDRWIGRGGPVPWPARSPDLTPLDFYLWSEIKRRVYVTEPTSGVDLKRRIRAAFRDVKRQTDVLWSLKDNGLKRARLCLRQSGGHFEQLLGYSIEM